MSALHSEPRISDREKVCATRWLAAAIDAEDPELAAYWQEQGLKARLARVAPGEVMVKPPVPEHRPSRGKPLPAPCPDCKSVKCKNSSCLL